MRTKKNVSPRAGIVPQSKIKALAQESHMLPLHYELILTNKSQFFDFILEYKIRLYFGNIHKTCGHALERGKRCQMSVLVCMKIYA